MRDPSREAQKEQTEGEAGAASMDEMARQIAQAWLPGAPWPIIRKA